MATNLDLKKLFAYDNEMRKTYGALRYFIYPFTIKKREFILKVRYADKTQDYHAQVCRSNCQRCRHFQPASASAVAAAVAASTAAVPSPSAAVAAPPAAVPAPPPSSAVLPVWKEATIRDPDGPHFVPGAARYRYDPTFGFFPHFHTGDGLLHVVSLGIGASFIVKSLLHSTGWLIVYNEICTPPYLSVHTGQNLCDISVYSHLHTFLLPT